MQNNPAQTNRIHWKTKLAKFVFLFGALSIFGFQPPAQSASGTSGKNLHTNIRVKKPRYPGFNDAGYRTLLISGEQGTLVNDRQITISGLDFTQYPGDGSAIVVTRITAPTANVFDFDKQKPRVTGDETVRFIRENEFDITGENWAYDHALKKININKNARITYNAPLKNILGNSAPSPATTGVYDPFQRTDAPVLVIPTEPTAPPVPTPPPVQTASPGSVG